MFRHSIYQQNPTNSIVRRNLFIDPSATGCQCRGNSTITENVFIDNPISIAAGGGSNYSTVSPNGVQLEVSYNAIIGDADISSSQPRGFAINASNGRSGSSAHHNLIVRSRNPSAYNVIAFATSADFNQASYMDYHDNFAYLWSASGKTHYEGGSFPAQDHAIFNNNVWDDPASGSNANNVSASLPSPYTEAQLFTALGCTDKSACAGRMIEAPELGWAVKARALLFAGYGR
jgi:hypothetical protein